MESQARTEWDQRYSDGTHRSLEPDPLLVAAYADYIQPAFQRPRTALDLAGGVGRHAIFLAERGWDVTLLDVSPVALDLAKREAELRGVRLTTRQSDLTEIALDRSRYGLILNFFYLERALFSQIEAALMPGGFLVFKTYTIEQLRLGGGPSHPMHLLEPNELLRAFSRLRILHYRETLRDKAVAELIARKE